MLFLLLPYLPSRQPFFMLIPCSKDFFRMSGIVRSIRFSAADYNVEQGAVKK
jgi:hypothetical protein